MFQRRKQLSGLLCSTEGDRLLYCGHSSSAALKTATSFTWPPGCSAPAVCHTAAEAALMDARCPQDVGVGVSGVWRVLGGSVGGEGKGGHTGCHVAAGLMKRETVTADA